MAKSRRTRRGFGGIRKLPSGRLQAYYTGPDLARHVAPATFTARADAEAWLTAERRLVERGEWTSPADRKRPKKGLTLAEYAPDAISRRRVRGAPLRPRTSAEYHGLLQRTILPALGGRPLAGITQGDVLAWYDGLDPAKPTERARAYALLGSLLGQAVRDEHIAMNPAGIDGAGSVDRARDIVVATPAEVHAIADAIRPRSLRLLVLICAWGGLRYGEAAELRRRDIDLAAGTVSIERAVVRVGGEDVVGPTKSRAGRRVVTIPGHILPDVEAHLAEHVGRRGDALLFAREGNRHVGARDVGKSFDIARKSVGRPDIRIHDLRHAGATWAAQAGATLGELMARIGHSTPSMALRYQHMANGRDAEIARRLSELVQGPQV